MSKWYIETWSPQDGIAFAQKCEPGERDTPSLTVALAPPEWQPFEVSAAAARRAERGPCQVRLYDPSDHEISFATLAALVDLVRQAYIGAGGGPADEEAPILPLAPNDGPSFPQSNAHEQTWKALRLKFLTADGKQAIEHFALGLEHELGKVFEGLFDGFAFRYRRRLSPPHHWTQDDLDFDRAVARMGYHGFPAHYRDDIQVIRILRGLLFRVPPPQPFSLGQRGARCQSLGDCLSYAMSSKHHIAQISLADFAVVLFAACAVVSGSGIHDHHGPNPDWQSRIRVEAARWLGRERPRVDPGSLAGQALQAHLA